MTLPEPADREHRVVIEVEQQPGQGRARLRIGSDSFAPLRTTPVDLDWSTMSIEQRSRQENPGVAARPRLPRRGGDAGARRLLAPGPPGRRPGRASGRLCRADRWSSVAGSTAPRTKRWSLCARGSHRAVQPVERRHLGAPGQRRSQPEADRIGRQAAPRRTGPCQCRWMPPSVSTRPLRRPPTTWTRCWRFRPGAGRQVDRRRGRLRHLVLPPLPGTAHGPPARYLWGEGRSAEDLGDVAPTRLTKGLIPAAVKPHPAGSRHRPDGAPA